MEQKKQSKTGGIVATVITALLCGCSALFACIFGVIGAFGQPFNTNFNGVRSSYIMPLWVWVGLLCLSVIFIAVPIVVGVLTLRTKKPAAEVVPAPTTPPSEPLPPAS